VLSATALVVAVLGWSTPAIAHGVRHALFAHNAGKVDGKSAVGSGATLNRAAGKLVATQGTGPNKGRFARKFINSAYAFVATPGATPAFNAARTRNFTAITSPATGEYCLTPRAGINPATSPLIVSVDWSNSSGSDLWVYWRSSGAGCPAGQYDVLTYQLGGDTTPDQTGTVAFVAYVP
jgi:hypothetical protein